MMNKRPIKIHQLSLENKEKLAYFNTQEQLNKLTKWFKTNYNMNVKTATLTHIYKYIDESDEFNQSVKFLDLNNVIPFARLNQIWSKKIWDDSVENRSKNINNQKLKFCSSQEELDTYTLFRSGNPIIFSESSATIMSLFSSSIGAGLKFEF